MRFLERYRYIALCIVFIILILSAYSNIFSSPAVLDDIHSFVDQPLTHIAEWNIDNLRALGNSVFGWGRWLPMVSFAFDIWNGSGELFFLHLTNIIIHILCFLSIIYLVHQVIVCGRNCKKTREFSAHSWEIAIVVAGIWALHPLQTNAVTYIVQRMASLVSLFFILSVATYLGARLEHIKGGVVSVRSMILYAFSILCMCLAFLCKENAVMIPVVFLCAEIWFFRTSPFQDMVGIVRRHWLICTILIIGACYVAFQTIPVFVDNYKNRHFTLLERLLTEPRIILWYISVLFYPHPSRLSLEHDVTLSTSLIHPLSTLFSIAILAGMGGWSFVQRKQYPLITFGLVWFLLNHVVESSFISLELIFEHRMYLPSVGMLLSIVVGVYGLSRQIFSKLPTRDFAMLHWCLVAVLSSILTLATFERNNAWHDIITFNRDNATKAPLNPRAHANYASALASVGEYEEAIKEAEKAIGLGKKYFEQYCVAANTIITSYISLGQFEKAASEGERFLRDRDKDSDAGALPAMYMNMAQIYMRSEDYKAAFNAAQEALRFQALTGKANPSGTENCIRLMYSIAKAAKDRGTSIWQDERTEPADLTGDTHIAKVLLEFGYRDKGRELLEKAIAANPGDELARTLLASLRKDDRQNYIQREKSDFTKKYVYQPFSRFNASMAGAFLIRSKQMPAPFAGLGESLLDYALRISPDSPDAHLLKGWYHFARDEWEAGVAEARRAIELDPDYAKAWLGMGFFLVKGNHSQEAVAAFRKSLELYPGSPQRKAISGMIEGLEEMQLTDVPAQALYPSESLESAKPNTGA